MATTVLRLSALAAAVMALISFSGCGGRGDEPSTATVSISPAAVAFSGQAVDSATDFAGKPRMKALSAPASQSAAQPVIDFRFVLATGGAKAAAALAAAPESEVGSVEWFLGLAERSFPDLFPDQFATQEVVLDGATYRYRFHQSANAYIGVQTVGSDVGGVYAIGPFTGGELRRFETVRYWTCLPENEPTFCGPKVLASELRPSDGQVIPAAGATNIPAKKTSLRLVYDQALNCAGVSGTGVVGQIVLTVTCDGQTVTFTPGEERWPFGTVNTVTVAGLRNLEGYPSASVSVGFTTRAALANSMLYVGNATHGPIGERSAAAVNLQSSGVTQINFDGSRQGFGGARRVAVDPLTGTVWYGMMGTVSLYRVDMETDTALDPILLDLETMHPVQGLILTDTDLCVAFGQAAWASYSRQNQLECRSRTTMQTAFKSTAGFLADASTMMTIGLRYLPFGTEKKLYALSADKASHFGEVWDGSGGIREGYEPGMKGEVTEIDATTYQVTNRFQVGSVPQGIDRDPATGDLYVVNSGDRSLSVITRNGRVTTVSLATAFTGMQRPMRIKVDQPRKKFYVTDYLGGVVVFDLVTRREVTRLPVGVLPVDLTMSTDSLYVVAMSGTVTEIALSTLTVRRTFGGLGWNSYAIDLYDK